MKTSRFLIIFLLAVALAGLVAYSPLGTALADDPTPTDTPTPTSTPTPTFTSTPTATTVPGASIIWADGPVTLSEALLDALAVLLEADPPEDAEGVIYATTNVSGVDINWNVSIVNLVDVAPPYEDWNMEDNAAWSWFVQCEGTEPTWTCEYYALPVGGGSTGFRFPWRSGYTMLYGVLGVHSGAAMVPGSSAVDFVSGNSMGTDAAPDTVIAAADGVITSVCSDGISMAIRVDGGPVSVAYFHFETGQTFSEGQAVTQGQVLGVLKHGTFAGLNCGWGTQLSDQYHLHFVFLETTPGYFEIGGCVLNMSSEQFVCDGNTYPIRSWLPNGGDSSDGDIPGDGSTAGGGAHIWDGIVAMIVELNQDVAGDVLPEQDPLIPYLIQKVETILLAAFYLLAMFYTIGMSGEFFFLILSFIIIAEISLLMIKLFFGFGRLIL